MKILDDYDTFKYKLLKNKYGYNQVQEEAKEKNKSPEEVIFEKYKRYKERGLNLTKIELELERKNLR